jgi:hypothetical protein
MVGTDLRRRLQAVGQPHEQPLSGLEQVLGHPAIQAEPAAADDRCLGRILD